MINISDKLKIFDLRYAKNRHTFEVAYGAPTAITAAGSSLLTVENFPDHAPFKFLDENVQVYEEVLVFLKKEEILKAEGWKNWGKKSMKKDGLMFKIGAEKRKLLGTAQKGKIGLTEKFEPYVFMSDGWRFSPNEVQCILKAGLLDKPITTAITTATGDWKFSPKDGITGPSGFYIQPKYIKDLRILMKFAKLV